MKLCFVPLSKNNEKVFLFEGKGVSVIEIDEDKGSNTAHLVEKLKALLEGKVFSSNVEANTVSDIIAKAEYKSLPSGDVMFHGFVKESDLIPGFAETGIKNPALFGEIQDALVEIFEYKLAAE